MKNGLIEKSLIIEILKSNLLFFYIRVLFCFVFKPRDLILFLNREIVKTTVLSFFK
jgi:hypothetical protein